MLSNCEYGMRKDACVCSSFGTMTGNEVSFAHRPAFCGPLSKTGGAVGSAHDQFRLEVKMRRHGSRIPFDALDQEARRLLAHPDERRPERGKRRRHIGGRRAIIHADDGQSFRYGDAQFTGGFQYPERNFIIAGKDRRRRFRQSEQPARAFISGFGRVQTGQVRIFRP